MGGGHSVAATTCRGVSLGQRMLPDAHCHAEAARAAEQSAVGWQPSRTAGADARAPLASGRGGLSVEGRVCSRGVGRAGGAHREGWVGRRSPTLNVPGGQGVWGERAKRARARRYAAGTREQCEEAGFWCWRGGKWVCSAGLAGDGGSRQLLQGYGRSVHPAVIPECCAWAANCGCFDGGRAGRGQRPVLAGEGPMVPSLWVACPALCARY